MGDFLELIQFLSSAGSAVIPWLLAALATYCVLQAWPHIVEWIKVRTKAQQDVAAREAERNEIMRNNNLVIANCNETMAMLKRFMESSELEQCNAIEHHEQLSAERMERIQKGVDDVNGEICKVRGDIGILIDRVH